MIYNKGYIGKGSFKAYINRKPTKEYTRWINILKRCYSEKFHLTQPIYKNCEVCEEWLNFQNFAKWFNENDIKGFEIDKDILLKGNKIYSPETCCFVPRELNNLFVNNKQTRGNYPVGIDKANNKYRVRIHSDSKINHLGCYDTIIEAFNIYKNFKENYIKSIADKYKNQITKETYLSLYNYIIEIND